VASDLVARLVAYLGQHAPPPGRFATSRGAEAVLAGACVVLTDWESAYRGGQLPDRAARLHTNPNLTVDALLAAVPDQPGRRTRRPGRPRSSGRTARPPRDRAARPAGIAGPVFVEHWADGDLLLPGTAPAAAADNQRAETVLLDVKPASSRSATRTASPGGSGTSWPTPGSTPATAPSMTGQADAPPLRPLPDRDGDPHVRFPVPV